MAKASVKEKLDSVSILIFIDASIGHILNEQQTGLTYHCKNSRDCLEGQGYSD